MTREEAKKKLPIIQAYAEGKEIEMFISNSNRWETAESPGFTMEAKNYRIKSEPKYRPFKTKEECWNEMLKHQPFGWVISKRSVSYVNLGSITQHNNNVEITFSTNEGEQFSTERLFNNYTFVDGTPFGSKLPTNI